MRSGSTGSSPSRAASRGAKGNNGALFLLGEAIQVGCAVYLLDDVDVGRDRSEMVFGALFSLTSILTHIANINDAIDATREYNSGQTKKEITLFVDSLGNPPPGYSQ